MFSPWGEGGGCAGDPGDFDHTMKLQWGEFDQGRGSIPARGPSVAFFTTIPG
jgi:hypothetical protein